MVFARFGTTLTRCSTAHIFDEQEKVALGIISILIFSPPQVCVNIIYGYLLIYIRKKLRSVGIVKVTPNSKAGHVKPGSYRAHAKRLSTFKTVVATLANQPLSVNMTGHGSSCSYATTKVLSKHGPNAGSSTAIELRNIRNNGKVRNEAHSMESRAGELNKVKQNQTNNIRLGWDKQRRVMITFGMVLVSLNVFMTPFEPRHEKTGILPMRKQRRRSASR